MSIEKALRHQVTIVVILWENMRQRVQSRDDGHLQEALSNMQYKACIPADIRFLQSCITSKNADCSSVNDDEFHNISIITAFNNHKDSINALESQRFTTETG